MADTASRFVYTARFPGQLYEWLREQVADSDQSLNDFIVGLAADLRDWFGLPKVMADSLEADRLALGLPRREYLMHLLTRRYEQLLSNKPGFDGAAVHPPEHKSKKR
jgi:hypothetical protein